MFNASTFNLTNTVYTSNSQIKAGYTLGMSLVARTNTASSNSAYNLQTSLYGGMDIGYQVSSLNFNDPAITGLRVYSYYVYIKYDDDGTTYWSGNVSNFQTITITREMAYRGLRIEVLMSYQEEIAEYLQFRFEAGLPLDCGTTIDPDWSTYLPYGSYSCSGWTYTWYWMPLYLKYSLDSFAGRGFIITNPYTNHTVSVFCSGGFHQLFSAEYRNSSTSLTTTPQSISELFGAKAGNATLYLIGS